MKKHHGPGFRDEAAWSWHHGESIVWGASWNLHNGGGIIEGAMGKHRRRFYKGSRAIWESMTKNGVCKSVFTLTLKN